jgi:hypothetical protein
MAERTHFKCSLPPVLLSFDFFAMIAICVRLATRYSSSADLPRSAATSFLLFSFFNASNVAFTTL